MMASSAPIPRRIDDIPALARLLGLPAASTPDEISRTFCAMANFDAAMAIESRPEMSCQDEEWEVRVIRASPWCRIEARPGCRGEWVGSSDEIPERVSRLLDLRGGTLQSRRGWPAWERMHWAQGRSRRLKARSGELMFRVEVPSVERPTGRFAHELRLEPIGAPEGITVRPITIPLPCPGDALRCAVETLRQAYVLA